MTTSPTLTGTTTAHEQSAPSLLNVAVTTALNAGIVATFGYAITHTGLGPTLTAILVGLTCAAAAVLAWTTAFGLEQRRAAREGVPYATITVRKPLMAACSAVAYLATFAGTVLMSRL